ncbi:MAG: hypothetical protein JRI68_02375 [Deltaproteobacteria bacterium]|nr:hypothetical protein [Deltaproteobacteria bacterium]
MNTDFIGTNVHGYQVANRVRSAKHWLVRSDGNVIGPVSLELLERGLEAGKIPVEAEMALLGGNTWRSVSEIFTAPRSEAVATPTEPVAITPIVDVDAPAQPAAALPVQTYPAPPPQPAVNVVPQPAQAYPMGQPEAYPAPAAFTPMAIPAATPSGHYPEDTVDIPKQGMMSALFG